MLLSSHAVRQFECCRTGRPPPSRLPASCLGCLRFVLPRALPTLTGLRGMRTVPTYEPNYEVFTFRQTDSSRPSGSPHEGG